jgi:hypothetical protein
MSRRSISCTRNKKKEKEKKKKTIYYMINNGEGSKPRAGMIQGKGMW